MVVLRGVVTITRNNDGKPMTMTPADYDRIGGWGFNVQPSAGKSQGVQSIKITPPVALLPARVQRSGCLRAACQTRSTSIRRDPTTTR